jgi:hypothetical protein
MRLTLMVAVLFCTAMLCTSVRAQTLTDVNLLLRAYDRGDRYMQQQLERQVSYIHDGLMWANAYLWSNGQPEIYCSPGKVALQGAQLIDMLRREAQERPLLGTMPVGQGLVFTLRSVFPCKAN